MVRGLLLGLVVILLAACDGVIGGAHRSASDDRPGGGTSVASGSSSATTLLRLTKEQHRNTLGDLLQNFLGDDAWPLLEAVDSVYELIPEDAAELDIGGLVGSTFARMAQTVGELHVRGYFEVALTVAEDIVSDESRRTRIFGECIDGPGEDHAACLDDFLDTFGLWTMRRPLTSAERTFFIDTVFADDGRDYAASSEALRDLLVALLTSPNFLYFMNSGGEEVSEGSFELDAFELASRLSYHFCDSMPDQELLDAAADGRLMTENGYSEQVDRIYADTRTAATFERFVFEWLELYKTGDAFGGVASGDVQKMKFIEGYDVSPALRDNMIAEVLDMAEYYRQFGTFEDLFTSSASFAKTEDLAAIYEVAVWDGEALPVPFPTAERIGLLGRAALLSAATVPTHPILRGVRIRENLMCDELGSPPANVNEIEQDFQAVATTRQRTEDLTSPSSCSGCHSLINGLGFPLEAFDSLGRLRESEMSIDIDGNVSMLRLDLESIPFIGGSQDTTTVVGPAQLSQELLASGKLIECFARHYVRFSLGLLADPEYGGDPSTVNTVMSEIDAGSNLSEVFKSVAFSSAFKHRLKGDDS
jgi:hypothetical protein